MKQYKKLHILCENTLFETMIFNDERIVNDGKIIAYRIINTYNWTSNFIIKILH